MKVNTLPALPYQESRPKHDGSYPLLLDTIMRLPQDINQHYFIRTTIVSNADEGGKVLSVVYNSDYNGYEDIMNYAIEEGASEVIDAAEMPLNGTWRIRFVPGAETWPDHNIPMRFIVEDPEGQLYTGLDMLPCESTSNHRGFLCAKRIIPLVS